MNCMLRRRNIAWITVGWLLLAATPLYGQFRIIPRERLDSLAHPATAEGCEAMTFERTKIDAGTLGEDDAPSTYAFRWRNTGESPLVVTRVQTTCGCAAAAYDKRPVLTNGTGEIKVTYRPKGHPGSFVRKIYVFTQLSDVQPTAILVLSGHVTPSVLPTADYPYGAGALLLRRQEVRIAGKCVQTERIECLNAGDKPLHVTVDYRLLPGYIAFSCEPEVLEPGAAGDLVIRFNPTSAPEQLPRQLPLLLEGVGTPPGQRTIRIRFGDAELKEK